MTVDAREIELTHTSDVVVGYRFWCIDCGAITHVSATPAQIAVLREFGASVAPDLIDATLGADVDDPQRRIVSMQILLDDDALAALEGVQQITDQASDDVPRS